MRSERVTFLVSPEDKAAMDAKAKAVGVTSSELIRLAVEAYDPSLDMSLLDAFADELERSVREARAALDAAHQEVALMLAEKAAQRRAA